MIKSLLAVLIIGVTALVAQTDSTKTYPLDPIVVTATKVEIARSLATPSISVISSDVLREERQKSVLSLISQRVPGVHIAERGLMGFGVATQSGNLTIRGVGGSPTAGVLMLMDGRPQFMGLMGHPLPDSYLMSSAERVEIIRGPSSLLYGSGAMGGVINVITRRPQFPGIEGDASASYGTFNSMQLNGNVRYSNEQYNSVVSISKEQTDGHRFSSKFDITSGYAKAGMKLNEHFALSIDGSYSQFTTNDPGAISNPRLDSNWYDIKRGYAGIGIDNNFGSYDGSARFIYNFGEHAIFDGFRSNDFSTAVILYENFRLFEHNTITAGLDYKQYGGDAKNIKTGFNFGNFSESQIGVYVNIQQILSHELTANAGARIEHSEQFGDEIIPQVGVSYRAMENTSVRASVAKGFRAPTIRELYLFPAPTKTLKPERMWNYEAGVTHILNNIISLDLTLFHSEGANIIQFSVPPPALKNSGSFKYRGIEFSTQGVFSPSLRGEASYGYTDVGNLTLSIPQHKMFISGTYLYSIVTGTVSLQYVSKIYGANNSLKRLPDYALLSAKVSAEAIQNIRLYVSGENLLDKEYQIIDGYPMPGRTFFAGANVSF